MKGFEESAEDIYKKITNRKPGKLFKWRGRTTMNWEEEFEQKFPSLECFDSMGEGTNHEDVAKALKSFISDLLKQRTQEVIEAFPDVAGMHIADNKVINPGVSLVEMKQQLKDKYHASL